MMRETAAIIEGSGPTMLRVRGQGGMWPFYRVMRVKRDAVD